MATLLKDKTIILGITASIAAYKSPDIARSLCKAGAQVYPVLTPRATDFIGHLSLEAVTGKEILSQSNKSALNYFKYLELAKKADLIIVAPATANEIAHVAHGFASDLLEIIILAKDCPLLMAPAMNERMWLNPITQENVAKLKELGVRFVGPGKGDLACGDEGIGRLANVADIISACKEIL